MSGNAHMENGPVALQHLSWLVVISFANEGLVSLVPLSESLLVVIALNTSTVTLH